MAYSFSARRLGRRVVGSKEPIHVRDAVEGRGRIPLEDGVRGGDQHRCDRRVVLQVVVLFELPQDGLGGIVEMTTKRLVESVDDEVVEDLAIGARFSLHLTDPLGGERYVLEDVLQPAEEVLRQELRSREIVRALDESRPNVVVSPCVEELGFLNLPSGLHIEVERLHLVVLLSYEQFVSAPCYVIKIKKSIVK